ncbi:MAG: ECF transporter S component [Lachnospiraceae bacterium]|nr:ECF transporter S component [Lachnospiraceae bacterium]
MENRNSKVTYMVELAVLIALILIMGLTPLGYIKTLGLEITLIVVPVAIGAITLGPKAGAILGGVFGLTSFYQCFGMSAFGAALLSINPVGAFITCVPTRILVGLLTGLIFKALHSKKSMKEPSYYIASLACPIMNTIFFMSCLVIFFYNTEYIQGFVKSLGSSNPFAFVIAFVGINGLVEAIACFVVASAVARALAVALKNR